MARRLYRLTNLPVAALGIAAAGVGVAALSLGNGDAVVESGFERALATMADRTDGARAAAISGSEQYWLTHAVHEPSTMLASKPVAVGDRITINSGGRDRVLHVVTVDKLDSSLRLASSEQPARLFVVTCRDQANPDARPVRFLMEAGDDLPALSAMKTARTL
jgi:hypothetical protein